MRRKKTYFKCEPGDPSPIVYSLKRRIRFGEVDAMAVMWHGYYAVLFEEVSTELRRLCGLTYEKFYECSIHAPVVQFHVDYFQPLMLDEVCTVIGKMIFTEASRINVEYQVIKEDGSLAASGFTVQMFVDAKNKLPFIVGPDLWQTCIERWINGEFN
ncbi:MAG: acyl-CoA thioesterase [Sedimentisphaerales bacterium]|nr:acyl-CoA thioesterase [Sedimentisphaerales bacterium]